MRQQNHELLPHIILPRLTTKHQNYSLLCFVFLTTISKPIKTASARTIKMKEKSTWLSSPVCGGGVSGL